MNRDSYLWDGTGEPDEAVEQLELVLGAYRSDAGIPDDSYLWNGSGTPDADVVVLERQLAEFRSIATVPDIELPAPDRARQPASPVPLRSRSLAIRLLPFAAGFGAIVLSITGIWLASLGPSAPSSASAPNRPSDSPVAAPAAPVDSGSSPPAPPPVAVANSKAAPDRRATARRVAVGASSTEPAPPVLPVPDRTASDAARRDTSNMDVTTALHLEQAQILLRSFRNAAPDDSAGLAYEIRRSRELLTRNVVLRRSAAGERNVAAYSVLSDVEPYLLDIANLDPRAPRRDVREIQQRVERSAIVAGVQLYARSGPVSGY